MLYCAFHGCTSLRELVTGMEASEHRLKHIGLTSVPRRSTIAESNAKIPQEAFESLFHSLARYFADLSPDSLKKRCLDSLFIIDSTTFTLFNSIMKGAGSYNLNGKKKGGAKAHVVLDSSNDYPVFVRVTEARMNDKTFLQHVSFKSGSLVVMDKGYNDYKIYAAWTQQKVTWVTRLNTAAVFEKTVSCLITDEDVKQGIVSDQKIILGNPITKSKTPLQNARLIEFKDLKENKVYQFITNDLIRSPMDIADIYKRRWQIEIFFKRLKQNFPLKYFLGDSENAVKIQIWCSLIADLLVKIVMEKLVLSAKKRWSFANLSGLIRQHLWTYISLMKFLTNPDKVLYGYQPPPTPANPTLFNG